MLVTRIYIQNRQVQDRNKGLTIYLSNSPKVKGQKVWFAEQDLPEWTIPLTQPTRVRYVTISLAEDKTGDTWLNLRKVKVFGVK